MKIDKWEHEALEILNKVEKSSQSIWIIGLLDLSVRSNFRSCQINLFIPNSTNKLLLANSIWLGPILITTLQNSTFRNDPPHLINDSLRHKHLLLINNYFAF